MVNGHITCTANRPMCDGCKVTDTCTRGKEHNDLGFLKRKEEEEEEEVTKLHQGALTL